MKEMLEYRSWLIKTIKDMETNGGNPYDIEFLKHKLKQIERMIESYEG